jgi:hypothetical protein
MHCCDSHLHCADQEGAALSSDTTGAAHTPTPLERSFRLSYRNFTRSCKI